MLKEWVFFPTRRCGGGWKGCWEWIPPTWHCLWRESTLQRVSPASATLLFLLQHSTSTPTNVLFHINSLKLSSTHSFISNLKCRTILNIYSLVLFLPSIPLAFNYQYILLYIWYEYHIIYIWCIHIATLYWLPCFTGLCT